MKICPWCAEELADEAPVCPHCGHDPATRPEPMTRLRPVESTASGSPIAPIGQPAAAGGGSTPAAGYGDRTQRLRPTNRLAVVAVTVVLLSYPAGFLAPALSFGVLAAGTVLGFVAYGQVARTGERGRELAIVAMALGLIGVIGFLVGAVR